MSQDKHTKQLAALAERKRQLEALENLGPVWIRLPHYQKRINAKKREIINLRRRLGL